MWGRWMLVFHTAGLCGAGLIKRAVPEEVEVPLGPCLMGGGSGRGDGAGAGGCLNW